MGLRTTAEAFAKAILPQRCRVARPVGSVRSPRGSGGQDSLNVTTDCYVAAKSLRLNRSWLGLGLQICGRLQLRADRADAASARIARSLLWQCPSPSSLTLPHSRNLSALV